MKITIKIQAIEIHIEDDAAAPAAITGTTAQALEQAIKPLIARHATNGKVATPRKPHAAAPAPETKATTSEPLPPTIESTEPATVQLNGHAPATNAEETPKPAETTTQTPEPKKRLPFEEFDKLVRAEMERLAPVPGTMPGHALWNELRDSQLPTMGAVVSRYDCTDLKGLAAQQSQSADWQARNSQ